MSKNKLFTSTLQKYKMDTNATAVVLLKKTKYISMSLKSYCYWCYWITDDVEETFSIIGQHASNDRKSIYVKKGVLVLITS